jgi:hypothetical protein
MISAEVQNVTHVRVGAQGEEPRQVKFKAVNLAKNDCREVVTAVTGKKIRVLSMNLCGTAGDGTATFCSDEDGTAISGAIPVDIDAVQPMMGLESEFGLMETTAGAGLWVTLSANMDLDGVISYVEV